MEGVALHLICQIMLDFLFFFFFFLYLAFSASPTRPSSPKVHLENLKLPLTFKSTGHLFMACRVDRPVELSWRREWGSGVCVCGDTGEGLRD